MPEHTSWFSYLVAMFPALGENMHNFGETFLGGMLLGRHSKPSAHGAEPLVASLFVMLLLIGLAFGARTRIVDYEKSVIPDDKLTLRTFFEILVGYFYDMMKDMMGPTRAKRYFPVVGTSAIFIVFSNFLGLVPGFNPPTANWNVTAGCALVVLVAFTYYGFQAQGFGFITHLAGPYLGVALLPVNILIFVIEFVSTFIIRPITLSIRLMLNMAVDHLLVSIGLSAFALFVPIPIMILSTLVCIVQVLVFCLLTSVYITLATETHGDHDHGHGDDHGSDKAHAH
jgi:F-type H+-transporting ATPase subunit a